MQTEQGRLRRASHLQAVTSLPTTMRRCKNLIRWRHRERTPDEEETAMATALNTVHGPLPQPLRETPMINTCSSSSSLQPWEIWAFISTLVNKFLVRLKRWGVPWRTARG